MLIGCSPGIGHVGPTLPLACAARAAGHEVRYAVAPENAGWLVAQGFDARATGLSHEEMLRRWRARHPETERMTQREQYRHLVPHAMVDIAARAKVAELVRLGREWPADLLVWTSSDLSGPISAALVGVPHVSHGVTVARPPGEAAEAFGDSIARLFADHGFAGPAVVSPLSSLSLDITPPSLAYNRGPGGA